MRNEEAWTPSKYVYKGTRLIGSRDTFEVNIGSRLISDLVAEKYQLHLSKYACGRLLDLGCGKVPLYQAYKQYILNCTCVDWPNSLHDGDHVDIFADLNLELPLPSSHYDTIVCSDVLEHIFEPQKLLLEINRLLSPRGRIIMNVPFMYWIHEHPHDYYRYTSFGLLKLLSNAKLRVIEFQCIGGAPSVLGDIVSKLLVHIPIIGPTCASFIQYITFKFQKSSLGEGITTKTEGTFPLGYFVVAEKADN